MDFAQLPPHHCQLTQPEQLPPFPLYSAGGGYSYCYLLTIRKGWDGASSDGSEKTWAFLFYETIQVNWSNKLSVFVLELKSFKKFTFYNQLINDLA